MVKKCGKHGKTFHFERKDATFRCGKCASRWVIDSRVRRKKKLVEMFGGKCRVCGYKDYVGALDFHHLDPSKKSFSLSVKGLSYAWETIFEEAKKCVLLCKNCHAEVENKIITL